jgi:hypothetical protein
VCLLEDRRSSTRRAEAQGAKAEERSRGCLTTE